ncbi:hypothetical protein [Stygiolobus caldivivus]|uniref:Membrane protein n=1 Tax=Stygiolobus caldivivus TaxID=2824673 RepID=A0A8D5ZH03_9CREN|nr:hypothetical protein [Stygiolobus caldivivus]BCU71413.1 membrane protein [Stygiolobus caldivivus]
MSNKLWEAFRVSLRNDKHLIRRYIILGAFDGILVAISVLLTSVLARESTPKIVSVVVSGIIGVTISSMWNTMVVEVKEKREELRQLELQMMRKLKGTIYDYSFKISIILTTLSHSLSPFFGLVSLIVYLSTRSIMLTVLISAVILSGLGILYEGDLKEKIGTAILMFIAGIVASLLSILISTNP